MLPNILTRKGRPRAAIPAAVSLTGLSARAASASTILLTQNCRTAPGSLDCRLNGVLDFLYAAAFILCIVLVAVIAVTIKIYRKNSSKDKGQIG
ncbi:MAG: hypothetical protein HIU91_14365 [Acidobacteria bacterium]|nr:hypothetical protein [Acidobacteriota bacterium]